MGFGRESIAGSVTELLELGAVGMDFLTPEARLRIFPHSNFSTKPNVTFVSGSRKMQLELNDVLCTAIHSAGMTLAKTFVNDTIEQNEEDKHPILIPPRHFLCSIDFYRNDSDELNLKPLISRPIHPPHLFWSPPQC